MSQITTSISPEELEALIRRVVREELTRLLQTPVQSILDDWKQEGPDNPIEDDLLLKDALAVLQSYEHKPEAWTSWEDFEAELDEADPRIAKVVHKINIRDQSSDFGYWQQQPYHVRLEALEQIRQEYHAWKYNAEPRFQRVYTIVKR